MKVEFFKIILGRTRIEFSLVMVGMVYQAKINGVAFHSGFDYNEARDALISGMECPVMSDVFH